MINKYVNKTGWNSKFRDNVCSFDGIVMPDSVKIFVRNRFTQQNFVDHFSQNVLFSLLSMLKVMDGV